MSKQWILFGTLSGFFGVLLGAFGAHALNNSLDEASKAIFHTAVQYQFFHALALIGLGIWSTQNPSADTRLAGWGFLLGILVFSGSLYILAITRLKFMGAITPIGGLSFLVGWIAFAFLSWKA
jgi:uncharacterized membrane protein YgdD (TMEM256/DUF423 family)